MPDELRAPCLWSEGRSGHLTRPSLDPSGSNQSQSMAHLSLSTQGQTIGEAICLQRIYGILTLDHLTGGTF